MILQNRDIFKAQKIDSLTIEHYLSYFYAPAMQSVKLKMGNLDRDISKHIANYRNKFAKEQTKMMGGLADSLFASIFIRQVDNQWFQDFIQQKPEKYWINVNVPVLALNGSKDLQVSPENLYRIKSVLKRAKNENITIELMQGHNHLFQKAETGHPQEYFQIKGDVSDETLKVISEWLMKVVK